MLVSEILTRARDFLTPERWTQGAIARDADGIPCSLYSPRAEYFCAMGAVEHACTRGPVLSALSVLDRCAFRDGSEVPHYKRYIEHLNDDPETTYEQIIALFDAAIAKAKEQEAGQ